MVYTLYITNDDFTSFEHMRLILQSLICCGGNVTNSNTTNCENNFRARVLSYCFLVSTEN